MTNAFRGAPKTGTATIKTLTPDTFSYPRLGPGQMWEQTATDIRALGGDIQMGAKAVKIRHAGGKVSSMEVRDEQGVSRTLEATQFIVSMPLRETVLAFDPPLPARVLSAAGMLRYRDFLTVALKVEGSNPFPDNWIYIHEPEAKLWPDPKLQELELKLAIGRPGTTCLGPEYFCFEGGTGRGSLFRRRAHRAWQEGTPPANWGLWVPAGSQGAPSFLVSRKAPIQSMTRVSQDNVAVIRDALASFTNLSVVETKRDATNTTTRTTR